MAKFFILIFAGLLLSGNPRAEDIKIRIAYPSGMNGLLVKTLQEAKLAEKHGLAPEYTYFQYGPPMMEAVAAGSVDVVVTSLNPVATFLTKNPGALVLIADLGASSHGLVVQPNLDAKSIKDLKGKSIGVSFNSESHVDLLVAIKDAGLDPATDVKILNVPPNELAALFQTKQVDAVVIRQPQLLKVEEKAEGKVIQRWPFRFIAVARAEFLKAHPDVEANILAAFREGILFNATHIDQAAGWFAANSRLDPAFIKRVAIEDPNFKATTADQIQLAISPDYRKLLEERIDLAHKLGLLKLRPKLLYLEK